MENVRPKPLIGIVGVCASGKTTLNAGLTALGFNCRHIAQEHSYVPTMWRRITNPDILIYLEVSYENTIVRKSLNWTRDEYAQQLFRLQDAIENAQIHINTDDLTPQQLIDRAVIELQTYLNG
ncbi:MAG: hypothetical protein KBF64_06780 [Anaerolineaceae bacterium]|jgi:hypothetical protein|nr:hypothetical protein [Anaerolineaceae bacterium]